MRGPAVFAGAVPAGVPELPADLEGDDGLAGAGGHGEQDAPLALQDGLDGAVDGDLLVVARGLAGSGGRRASAAARRCSSVEPLPACAAAPRARRAWGRRRARAPGR